MRLIQTGIEAETPIYETHVSMNKEQTPRSVPARSLIARISSAAIALAVVLVVLPLGSTLFAGRFWACDLATHFRVQYVVALIPVILVCLLAKRWKTALAFLALLGFASMPMIKYYMPDQRQPPAVEAVRFVTFNVKRSNDEFSRAVTFLREEKPDVVALFEIDERWKSALAEISESYPYVQWELREDNFGLCLFSRIPWSEIEVFRTETIRSRPSIFAQFEINGRPVQYLAIHPATPLTPESARSRNEQLSALTKRFDLSTARILTGDFNLTPWSPVFHDVLAAAEVRDAACGFGIDPTWYQLPTPVGGIKIDHFLVSDDVFVLDHRVGPYLGSDHRPVVADLLISSE
ncbi:MAG: endonuclease/exonuclease/phosphatase family protein [Planctomycetota bacterium]